MLTQFGFFCTTPQLRNSHHTQEHTDKEKNSKENKIIIKWLCELALRILRACGFKQMLHPTFTVIFIWILPLSGAAFIWLQPPAHRGELGPTHICVKQLTALTCRTLQCLPSFHIMQGRGKLCCMTNFSPVSKQNKQFKRTDTVIPDDLNNAVFWH